HPVKTRIDRDQLADAIVWTAKSLPARPSVPVLACIKLTSFDGGLMVEGFDYEVSNQTRVEATTSAPGSVLVSGRLLAEIAKALPHKPVELSAAGVHLEMVCGSARVTLPTAPVEDYPALPQLPTTAGSIDTATFATAVAQGAVAVGRDDTLPMMTGIRMEIRGDQVTLLATDRYRLAMRELQWNPQTAPGEANLLVPATTLHDTTKMLTAHGGNITLAVGKPNQGEGIIGLSNGARHTTSRLLDGDNYPPVRSLFPDTHNGQARIDVAALVEVVKRVSLVAERTTPVVLTFNDGGLTVEAGGTEEARASEAMDADYSGDPLTVGFNPQYLIDGLQQCRSPQAVIRFVDAFKPAVIHPTDDGGDISPNYRYLIMPIRVTR